MMAKERGVPTGAGLTSYLTRNERADIVKTNLLTEGLSPQGMWDEMHLHFKRYAPRYAQHPLKYQGIEVTVSLALDDSENMSREELANIVEDLVGTIDNITEVTDKNGRKHSNLKKTNLANTQYIAAVHHDSKGGKLHFHLLLNYLDKDGFINNRDYLGLRAGEAARIINEKYGWKDPMKIREERLAIFSEACENQLRNMERFDLRRFLDKLQFFGYDIHINEDSNGVIHGYSFNMGNSTYKASELGTGRCYTVKNLEKTWKKLHGKDSKHIALSASTTKDVLQPKRPNHNYLERLQQRKEEHLMSSAAKLGIDTRSQGKPSLFTSLISVDGKDYSVSMKNDVYSEMEHKVDNSDYGNAEKDDVMTVAMLLFMGYVDAATNYQVSHGGCGSPGTGWGRDKDEDEYERAHRAASRASWMCKPSVKQARSGRKR